MLKVAQCWDDGVLTDIRLVNILREYNAKATFNLCPGWHKEERSPIRWNNIGDKPAGFKGFVGGRLSLKDLTEIYRGFKVASHCWNHESVTAFPADEVIKAAVDARKFLEDTFQIEAPGFAWPGGRTTAEAAEKLKAAGFAYGRTVEEVEDFTANTDTSLLASNCHFHSRYFWERYQYAREHTGVFYFWGHSYEMMEYDKMWERMEDVIRYISEDPEAEWVDVIDIVPLCCGGEAK